MLAPVPVRTAVPDVPRLLSLRAGDVLVRIRAADRGWARALPPVPSGEPLTVSVGGRDLLPIPGDDLVAAGYRLVGVATEERRTAGTIDVLVPAALRHEHPDWWRSFAPLAERVFDLRLGPVQLVLAPELDLHLAAGG